MHHLSVWVNACLGLVHGRFLLQGGFGSASSFPSIAKVEGIRSLLWLIMLYACNFRNVYSGATAKRSLV
jgi:hypothetical protein